MNDLEKPHRRWLDAAMPDAAMQRTDLEHTRAAVASRGAVRWRVTGIAAAAGALAIAIAVARREPAPAEDTEITPTVAAPVDWGVRFALHVDGRPSAADVRIHIAVRRESTP